MGFDPCVKNLIKGLHREEQNKFNKNSYLQWGWNLGPPPFLSNALLFESTWQVLVESNLTSLLFMHQLTFGLRRLTKTNTT